jgi:hypothetical protein
MDGSFYGALIVLYNAEPRLALRSDIAVEWLAVLHFREVLSLIMDPKPDYSIAGFPWVPRSLQSDASVLFYIAPQWFKYRDNAIFMNIY